MTDPKHEGKILENIEELNFCYQCGKELDSERELFSTCFTCDRAFCVRCSRCACDSPATDAVVDVSNAAQKFLDSLVRCK